MSVSESGVRPILAEAVDLARRALLELQPTGVGEHLGVTGEDECAATHHFAATLPGYRGWQWAVVVAAAPDAEYATVSESALLPGPDALVAPEFVPWEKRIRPGDLAPGDLLAPRVDDPRLVPGYLQTGDPVVDEVCEEVGLGRRQVLSREGRLEAAERWYSEFGPETDMARSAPGTCGVCGFFVPLAGALRAAFGVCANAMGADGRVVHVEYGCGAHSDTEVPTGAGSPLYEAYDDAAIEVIPAEELTARSTAEPASPESADAGTAPSETQPTAAATAEVTEATATEAAATTTEPAGNAPDAETASAAETTDPQGLSAATGDERQDGPVAGSADAVEGSTSAEDIPAAAGTTRTEAGPTEVAATGEAADQEELQTTDSTGPASDETAAAGTAEAAATGGATDQGELPAAATGPAPDETAADAGTTRSASAEPAAKALTEAEAGGEAAATVDLESAEPSSEIVEYSGAWTVSAVRVQPGEPGSAEEH